MRTISALALAALAVFSTAAQAQWPQQPITMIVPWAAGGGTDAIARVLASEMEKELGQPVNVVNRTGGSGVVGHAEISASAADGYTIGLATAEFISYYWTGVAEFTFEDVTPIGLVNFDPGAFSVGSDSEWQDLEQALAAIGEAPAGTYKVSAPIGGAYHIALSGLLRENEIDPKLLTVVPVQGAAPGLQELASGGVQVAPFALPEAKAMIESGHARALAVFSPERSDAFPDVPTVAEALGTPFVSGTWRGIISPPELDPAVTTRLADALEAAVNSEAYKSFVADRGFGWGWMREDAYGEFLKEQHETTGAVLSTLGLNQRD